MRSRSGGDKMVKVTQKAEASVRSVRRALELLMAFARRQDSSGYTLKELSEEMDLPRTTTLRLLNTLEQVGFLQREPFTDRYVLGPVILQLGAAASRHYPLQTLARPSMVWLRNFTLETVNLYVPQDIYRICIAQEESPQSVRQVIELGRPLPLWRGASGLVLLAFMPEAVRTVLLDRLTGLGHIHDHLTFIRQLEEIRAQGWALTHGHREAGASSLAAPIFAGDEVVAALAISGPTSRFQEERVRLFIAPLLEKTKSLSEVLGHKY